ncbi:hypothetical protein AB0F43_23890 [Kribbella sp. NPDC023972]|uniref:hypothetical protein n=1 Tax=Kribbella sp. NPDC023972 TaxID=3154795 RepID=UPI0033DD88C4
MDIDARARGVARVLGWVGFGTAVCLAVFFAIGGVFGPVNDVGNALLGVLSAVLAWSIRQAGAAAVALAGVGSAITVVGSVLILSDTTGYYLAGLVSSAGFALIGGWLIAVNRRLAGTDRSASRLPLLGTIAGAVMLIGLIGVPGIPAGVDDMDTAPAYTYIAGFNWLGTYVLFPTWALLVSRMRERQQPGPIHDRSGL